VSPRGRIPGATSGRWTIRPTPPLIESTPRSAASRGPGRDRGPPVRAPRRRDATSSRCSPVGARWTSSSRGRARRSRRTTPGSRSRGGTRPGSFRRRPWATGPGRSTQRRPDRRRAEGSVGCARPLPTRPASRSSSSTSTRGTRRRPPRRMGTALTSSGTAPSSSGMAPTSIEMTPTSAGMAPTSMGMAPTSIEMTPSGPWTVPSPSASPTFRSTSVSFRSASVSFRSATVSFRSATATPRSTSVPSRSTSRPVRRATRSSLRGASWQYVSGEGGSLPSAPGGRAHEVAAREGRAPADRAAASTSRGAARAIYAAPCGRCG
jgi:hypothetical protein